MNVPNKLLYTAEATVTGGRANGRGRTTDGLLDVQLRSPKEMGGEGGATNPEQLQMSLRGISSGKTPQETNRGGLKPAIPPQRPQPVPERPRGHE